MIDIVASVVVSSATPRLLAMVIECAIMVTLDIKDLLYSGPYPWIGATSFFYTRYTPRLHPKLVSVVGLAFSEKSVFYMLSFYVICYRPRQTLFPSMLGMLAAYIFANFEWDFPSAMSKMMPFEQLCSSLLEPPPRVYAPLLQPQSARTANLVNNLQQQRGTIQRLPEPAPTPPAIEEIVEQLTAMGFDRQRVLEALRNSNNSVELAADRLLAGL